MRIMRHAVVVMGLMVGILSAGRASAQTTFERGWIDVNFGMAVPAEDGFAMSATGEIFFEPADFGARYNLPLGAAFDFGGGVMITPVVGVGVSFTGTAHQDTAALTARIPHPIFANLYATDEAPTDEVLQRIEGGVNIHAMIVAAQTPRFRFRVFGGPTFFRVQQDAVTDIRYNQVFRILPPANVIEITEFDSDRIESTGWGFHAGADASFFFTRVVGVGGVVRFSRGNVDLEDTLASAVGDSEVVRVKAGGLQVGGGLRLKF